MALDFVDTCLITTPQKYDQKNVYKEQFTTRMSPNKENSCTTSPLCEIVESPKIFFKMRSPWNPYNSPRTTSNNMVHRQNHSTLFLPTPSKSKVAPIISLKIREALRSLSCRDQESLAEEILQLKKTLLERDIEIQRRRVQVASVEAENRKLAKDIEILETNTNVEGPHTGNPRKLRSKIASLKEMLEETHNTCELQAIELYELRRDIRLTHARELEVERNVYASEVHRLQQLVKKLKIANNKVENENHVVGHLKAKNHHLEVMNLRLSSCLSASLSQIPRNSRNRKTPRTLLQYNTFDEFGGNQLHQRLACEDENKIGHALH